MTMRYRIGAALAAIALVALTAVPALAASESGYKNCASSFDVWITSETTGTTRHYAPTGTLWVTYNNGVLLQRRTTGTNLEDSSWKVTTTGTLYGPGTFAFCYL
jgi:hypothetical protein